MLDTKNSAHLFPVKTLVKDDTDRPDVHLGRNFWGFLAHHEALGREVPCMKEIVPCIKRTMPCVKQTTLVVKHDTNKLKITKNNETL